MTLRSVLSNAEVRWNPFEAIVGRPTLVFAARRSRARICLHE